MYNIMYLNKIKYKYSKSILYELKFIFTKTRVFQLL